MDPHIVRPNTYVALRFPSGAIAVHEIKFNTVISIGKYGSFETNHLIGRPFHYTYEILDAVESGDNAKSGLRIVPPAELYAEIKDDDDPTSTEPKEGGASDSKVDAQYEVVDPKGEVLLRTNRNIVDDVRTQTMTMDEIELLKAEGKGSGRDLIAKILHSHTALDQKTAFALAKYTLRKTKKYLRQFTLLPLDVPLLAKWILTDRDASKIMEMREETLALIGSWSNIHFTPPPSGGSPESPEEVGHGRWLVVDDTGGLLVAAAAEKLGILHSTSDEGLRDSVTPAQNQAPIPGDGEAESNPEQPQEPQPANGKRKFTLAQSNTITLVHANSQPNLSLLRYFNFDAANPMPSHPLSRHFRTISWLQLLYPEEDNACTEPETVSLDVLQTWKTGKRSNYHRKRRRWERTTSIVCETQAGGFDGLIIASSMSAPTILHNLVPLLRGAAQVVVYSPTVEPLVELADYYSTPRRVAYLNDPPPPETMPAEDFPVDPTLLLAPTVQTVRCRHWQTLPGRTHPIMTGRGGADGYVFHATRVLPAEGGVQARGISKKRKLGLGDGVRELGERRESEQKALVEEEDDM
ncbi:MAG: hypothetical protein Q9211_006697 [Gyalolechia sp. 1 TL-2023]